MLLIPTIVATLIGIVYSLALLRWKKEEFWNWCHAALATLLSVAIGISVAMGIFQLQQAHVSKQERVRYVKLLTLELSYAQHSLRDTQRTHITTRSGQRFEAQLTGLHPASLDAAANSGLFSDRVTFIMHDLSGSMLFWNTKTESFLASLSTQADAPGQTSSIKWYAENLERARAGILRGIALLAEELEIELRTDIVEHR